MSLRSQLRMSNPLDLNLERARHGYPGREVIETQGETRYLQLQLVNEDGRQATAFFNVDLWLENMNSYLPDIPWQEIPSDYLVRWLNTLQLNFLVEDIAWTVENIIQPGQPVPARLLSLIAEPCTILCLDWPVNPKEETRAGISLSQLPLNLRYVLGTSQAELSALVDLLPGDLLIIRQRSYCLAIGQCNLFSFSYQGNDEVAVEKIIFDSQSSEQTDEEHLLDWNKLPVDIEFVLDNKTITLGQLNDINIGSTLPVSVDAEQKIKVYLNRKFFALARIRFFSDGYG